MVSRSVSELGHPSRDGDPRGARQDTQSRWMLAWGKSTMRAFAGATATSGYTRKRESAHIKNTARLFASQMSKFLDAPPLSARRRQYCGNHVHTLQSVTNWSTLRFETRESGKARISVGF